MKKRTITATSHTAAAVLAVSFAVPAFAQSGSFSAANCNWPTHAFLEIESTGSQYLSVTGTNGQTNTGSWPSSGTVRRNYTNSPTEDANSGYASTSAASWFKAGWGCSV